MSRAKFGRTALLTALLVGQNGPVPVLQFASEEEAMAIIELYGRPEGPLKMYVEILNPPGEPIQSPGAGSHQ